MPRPSSPLGSGEAPIKILPWQKLRAGLRGTLQTDELAKMLYATDASVYRRVPLAVAFPKDVADIQQLIAFASEHGVGLIPRAAGTSLAGQCVGEGIVVDVSKHFTRILELNVEQRTVTVQPGVIRDDLNRFLAPHGLFFGPNTSTSNRCMLGGMVGNNSSGTTSIRYGVTRDKVICMQVVLADGCVTTFTSESLSGFAERGNGGATEKKARKLLHEVYSEASTCQQIIEGFPDPRIRRRNSGYALDELIGEDINICSLLCGSEGTLAFTTEITLQLDPLPPPYQALVVGHFMSIDACLQSVLLAMEHELYQCEMLDRVILDLTRQNPQQARNRELIQGDPAAVLFFELRGHTEMELDDKVSTFVKTLHDTGLSYANPVLVGNDIERAIDLRLSGLGILGNMIGDEKAVACIEDTAVPLVHLPEYIARFTAIMQSYEREPVYYAHAGAGEIHLRPILNLKRREDVQLFKAITDDVAHLVKEYRGSMSGEHGDGIVRAQYIPLIVGEQNYELMRRIKSAFDPQNIFNPGKIIEPFAMDEKFRYEIDRIEPEIETFLNFSDNEGILRFAEKCNGTGTCRRTAEAGGIMCPSYKATLDEKDSTRGRANVLREVLTLSDKANKFDHEELVTAYDLCLSCKGCAKECPSTVDVATLKAEFLYQYQEANGYSLRNRAFAYTDYLNRISRINRPISNFILTRTGSSSLLKRTLGVAPQRTLPPLSKVTLRAWAARHLDELQPQNPKRTVHWFADEFTNQLDASIGIDALELLTGLGYRVQLIKHPISGRAYISKGFLRQARKVAEENVSRFYAATSAELPLLGLEPSAILSFRDEYPRLVRGQLAQQQAQDLGSRALLIDEFLATEIQAGNISQEQFCSNELKIKLHTHCHQKALSDDTATIHYLSLPQNYHVDLIPAGCCGMAGSFGYEVEHYELSMQIADQVLLPAIASSSEDTVIAATGTSCRHQILDGSGRTAVHPVSLLRQALLK